MKTKITSLINHLKTFSCIFLCKFYPQKLFDEESSALLTCVWLLLLSKILYFPDYINKKKLLQSKY